MIISIFHTHCHIIQKFASEALILTRSAHVDALGAMYVVGTLIGLFIGNLTVLNLKSLPVNVEFVFQVVSAGSK